MNKLSVLLLTLITTLAATACSSNVAQESVASAAIISPKVQAEVEEEVSAATPSAEAAAAISALPVIGPAPEWSNDVWINSEAPLPLEDLRGKVVLLEFWTFG